MIRFTYVMHAEPGERFARDAFARQIGKRLPLQINGHECGRVTVVGAEVSPDGTSVEIMAVLAGLAAQREETVTEDCHRCRHWTPAQRKWHHCIHCDGTGQVPAQQEENTR